MSSITLNRGRDGNAHQKDKRTMVSKAYVELLLVFSPVAIIFLQRHVATVGVPGLSYRELKPRMFSSVVVPRYDKYQF